MVYGSRVKLYIPRFNRGRYSKYAWNKRRTRPGTSKASRYNSLFRKFTAPSRRLKPELKYIDTSINANINANQYYTNSISPFSIVEGTNYDQRVGNRVRSKSLRIRMKFVDNSNQTTPAVSPYAHTYMFRVVLWTPRLEQGKVTTYLQTVSFLDHIKPNYCTVVHDKYYKLSPCYVGEASTNDPAGPPRDFQMVLTKNVTFPRKIVFNDTDNLMDIDKDVMYISIWMDSIARSGISFTAVTRMFYYDT